MRLDLRWPNDLDLGGRKAGGILCVSRVVGDRRARRLRHRPQRSPADRSRPPRSIRRPRILSDAAPHVEREVVLAGILGAMDGLVDVLARPHDVAHAWEQRADLRGRPYRVRLDATARS